MATGTSNCLRMKWNGAKKFRAASKITTHARKPSAKKDGLSTSANNTTPREGHLFRKRRSPELGSGNHAPIKAGVGRWSDFDLCSDSFTHSTVAVMAAICPIKEAIFDAQHRPVGGKKHAGAKELASGYTPGTIRTDERDQCCLFFFRS